MPTGVPVIVRETPEPPPEQESEEESDSGEETARTDAAEEHEQYLHRGAGQRRRDQLAVQKRLLALKNLEYESDPHFEFGAVARAAQGIKKNKKDRVKGKSRKAEGPRRRHDPKEYPMQWQIFQLLDIDQNGFITAYEMKQRFDMLGYSNEVNNVLLIMDIDKDNKVSFDEFVDGFAELFQTNMGQRVVEAAAQLAQEQGIEAMKEEVPEGVQAERNAWAELKAKDESEDKEGVTDFFHTHGTWRQPDEFDERGFGIVKPAQPLTAQAKETILQNRSIKDMYWGDYEEVQIQIDNHVRIFLSSTFTDTSLERNFLMENVWPEVRKLCLEVGLQFEVVDLRWGIRDEANDDHQVLDICENEIARCKQGTIGPNFIYISCDKYGWRPLPPRMDSNVYMRIFGVCSTEEREKLDTWYIRDDNCKPPVYKLRTISANFPEYKSQNREEHSQGAQKWWDTQMELHSILVQASLQLGEQWKQMAITEFEVRQGVLNAPNRDDTALCFMRSFSPASKEQIVSDPDGGGFMDLKDGKVDTVAQKLLHELRQSVRASLSEDNIREYTVEYVPGGVTMENHTVYVHQMALDVRKQVLKRIKIAIERAPKLDAVTREVGRHALYCQQLARLCHGRDSTLRRVQQYVSSNDKLNCPLVLHGPVGIGKSCALAKCAIATRQALPAERACVITRFLGYTAESTSTLCFLTHLLQHLAVVCGIDEEIPESVDEIVKAFPVWVDLIPRSMRVVILIDSLESLERPRDDDTANVQRQTLQWLPSRLPSHVRVVVTVTTEDQYLGELRDREWEPHAFFELQKLDLHLCEKIIDKWLDDDHRKLTRSQRGELSEAITSAEEGGCGLFLRLAYTSTRHWSSYDALHMVPRSVHGLILQIFRRLETEFGHIFIKHAFGYLSSTRYGLAEKEWLDILSCDEEVMTSVLQYHQPPMRRVPPAIFSRLLHRISDYMGKRATHGSEVHAWLYKPFWTATSYEYLKTVLDRRQLSLKVAEYFDGILHFQFMQRNVDRQQLYPGMKRDKIQFISAGANRQPTMLPPQGFNERKVAELPAALLAGGAREQLVERLADLELFRIFQSDHSLQADWLGFWRDVLDLADPEDVYTEVLEARYHDAESEHMQLEAACMYEMVATFLDTMARFKSAITMCTIAMQKREQVLGAGHIDIADDLMKLANMCANAGDYEQALHIHLRSLKILKENLGPASQEVAVAEHNLATLYQGMERNEEALELYLCAMQTLEELGEGEGVERGLILSNIGSLYMQMNLFEEALKELQKALPILENNLGKNSILVAKCLNNLGCVLMTMRQPAEAIQMFQRDLDISESVLGAVHPDVAVTLGNMAQMHSRCQDHKKAIIHAKRSIEISAEVYGPEHVKYCMALNTLGGVYAACRDFKAAVSQYDPCLATLRVLLGPEHGMVASVERNLVGVLSNIPGQFEAAVALCEHVETVFRGGEDYDARLSHAQALQDLGEARLAVGDFSGGVANLKQAIDKFKAVLGEEHVAVSVKYNQLCVLYEKLGYHDEALELMKARMELKTDHGRVLPAPLTMEDHLEAYFFNKMEMAVTKKRVAPIDKFRRGAEIAAKLLT